MNVSTKMQIITLVIMGKIAGGKDELFLPVPRLLSRLSLKELLF